MFKKTTLAASLAVASALLFSAGVGFASGTAKAETATKPAKASAVGKPRAVNYARMRPEALAEHLIFNTDSFDLAQPTQEGTTGRDRLTQDETQKVCSELAYKRKDIDGKTAEKIQAMAEATIKYPEGGIKLGDWKKGRELAWSGFGYRTAHNPDVHGPGREPGANCYNCHQLAEDRMGGTLGPSLTGFGKLRGSSPEMLKYAYDVIYNPHVYFACSSMPRMGANGVMTQEQIQHVLAYLFDPASPVNK